MKKVLIIIHLPRASPRIEGLARYLPEFGWEPIILTGVTDKYKDLPARIIETPYRNALGFLGRVLGVDPEKDARSQIKGRFAVTAKKSPLDFFLALGGEVVNYPCPDKNWGPFALKAAREFLSAEKMDAIISSSPPVIGHLIARELKAEYGIPWVGDIRDLWSQNHNYGYSPLRRALDRRLEIKTLSQADALVAVAEPWAQKLKTLHKGKPVYTITLGFDLSEVNIPPARLTDRFTITFTGSIYTGKQDPAKLFAALGELVSRGIMSPDRIEVRFYGPELSWLDKEAAQYGLNGIVRQYGLMPRSAVLEKQRESQVLLQLGWEGREQVGYSGKLFEYLAARRPILSTGEARDLTPELFDETKAGVCAVTIEDIKNVLEKMYAEYQRTGEVVYKGEEAKVNKYTNQEMARKMAQILDGIDSK